MFHKNILMFLIFLFLFISLPNFSIATSLECDKTSTMTINQIAQYESEQHVVSWHPTKPWVTSDYFKDNNYLVRVFDVETGKEAQTIRLYVWTYILAYSPDGKYLANLGGPAFELIEVESGESVYTLDFSNVDPGSSHYGISTSLSWSPDNSKLIFVNDFKLHMLDVTTFELEIFRSEIHFNDLMVLGADWHPSGDYVAIYDGYGNIVFWDTQTLELQDKISWKPSRSLQEWDVAHGMSWNPTGTQIAVLNMNELMYEILIWDVASKELLTILPGCKGWVTALSWSPDGQYLAVSYGQDEYNPSSPIIRLWDMETYEIVGSLSQQSTIFALDWSSDGKYLAGVNLNPLSPEITIWEIIKD